MIKKLAWNAFKNTGDINTFLEFKEIESTEKNLSKNAEFAVFNDNFPPTSINTQNSNVNLQNNKINLNTDIMNNANVYLNDALNKNLKGNNN